jgi:hypothetical protein
MARTWEEVDERVLRWVLGRPSPLLDTEILELPLGEPEPFAALEGLDTRQVSEALYRLASAGLIQADHENYGHDAAWWHLRVAPLGLKVLGEWPDLERIASAVGIHELLLRLAHEAGSEEQTALRRAAGLVGRTSADVVRQTITALASDVAKDVVE